VIWIDREREETQIGREKDTTRQREEEREGGRERARERASERANGQRQEEKADKRPSGQWRDPLVPNPQAALQCSGTPLPTVRWSATRPAIPDIVVPGE
jgi:hypothetical protein